MKRGTIISLFCFASICVQAQIGPYDRALVMPTRDLYDTNMMISALNVAREISQRVSAIRSAVQPFREQQYKYYREGKYREAIDLCVDVHNQYVNYIVDNKAIIDMEILAGDCGVIIKDYETAIDFYKIVKQFEEEDMNNKLSQVFNIIIDDARIAYSNNQYVTLWNKITLANMTGIESGECYYYFGVCYENSRDFQKAKKMYKLAKKNKYKPAIAALQELKKRK